MVDVIFLFSLVLVCLCFCFMCTVVILFILFLCVILRSECDVIFDFESSVMFVYELCSVYCFVFVCMTWMWHVNETNIYGDTQLIWENTHNHIWPDVNSCNIVFVNVGLNDTHTNTKYTQPRFFFNLLLI